MSNPSTNAPGLSLLKLIAQKRTLVEKHLTRYDVQDDGCWRWNGPVWQSSKRKGGQAYGCVSFKYEGRVVKVGAHRLAYAYHCQIDPGDLVVMHSCDFPLCINKHHLGTGTNQDNVDDRVAKGRSNNSKLSLDDVKFIISRLHLNTDAELAQFVGYKVRPGTINQIRKGKTWKHLLRPQTKAA